MKKDVIKEVLFFENEKSALEHIDKWNFKFVDTVFLKTKDRLSKEFVLDMISKVKEYVKSIVYIDDFNFEYNRQTISYDLKAWQISDITDYTVYFKEEIVKEDLTIPLVTIVQDNNNKFFADEMAKFFKSQGYNCGLFSQDYLKALSQAEYLSEVIGEKEFKRKIFYLNMMIEMRNLDMCIIEIKSNTERRYKEISDIYVEPKEEYFVCHYENKVEKFDSASNAIIDFIYRLLTEE